MIFISYRRADSKSEVTHLYYRLVSRYGVEQVFVDFDQIPPGKRWADVLRGELMSRAAVLAVIGATWEHARNDDGGLRLGDPEDWVRQEVCTGIRERKHVVPVLVDRDPLPGTLRWDPGECELNQLAGIQGHKLRYLADYEGDFRALCEWLEEHVPGLCPVAPRRPDGRPRPMQVPAPVPDFVGREPEIRDVVASLRAGTGVNVAAARGIGGAGKTEVAKVVAARLLGRFPAGQMFVDLRGVSDNPTTPADAMRQVVLAFHPEAKLPDAAEELLPLYRTVLANAGRVLVVLDNAKDKAQVKDLVSAPPPAGFVVTSRATITLPGVRPVNLERLDPAEALALLRGIVGPDRGTDAELAEIARLCAHLPLALRVAGNYLVNDPIETVPGYVAKLATEREKHLHDDDTDVTTVLAYSARQLARDNPDRAERWQMLSVFPADFDEPAAAAVMGLEQAAAHDHLVDLLNRGLIQFDDKTRRFRLHDLLRLVAAKPLDPARRDAAEQRFAAHYVTVLRRCGEIERTKGEGIVGAVALFDREAANIRRGQSLAAAWFRADRADRFAAGLCRGYPNNGVYAADLRLHPREKVDWLELAVEACHQLGDKANEGVALGNLGLAWADLGDARKAIAFHEQVLAIARETGDRRGEGQALGNLGIAWAALGDARKAVAFYEQDLAIARETGDRRGEGQALGNLGIAWADLGDARKAIAFHEQVLAIARETGDRAGGARANWNLAVALVALGRNDEAIPHAEKSLAFFEEIGHPCVEEDRKTIAKWRGEVSG